MRFIEIVRLQSGPKTWANKQKSRQIVLSEIMDEIIKHGSNWGKQQKSRQNDRSFLKTCDSRSVSKTGVNQQKGRRGTRDLLKNMRCQSGPKILDQQKSRQNDRSFLKT